MTYRVIVRYEETAREDTWVTSVVVTANQYYARCGCGWVDLRCYFGPQGADRRAQQHLALHVDGLIGGDHGNPELVI
jgi:hypothetical protein